MPARKLYCYIDETGQDPATAVFSVVAVVSDQDQERLRARLVRAESRSRTGGLKWHKTQAARRLNFLDIVLLEKLGHGEVFFGSYPKPIPYFFPLLKVLEHGIRQRARVPYTARVYVDGIDRKKAAELTSALRASGITLELVKSRRDESEPVIRLADMWAGCIRAASFGRPAEQALLERARRSGYLEEMRQQKTP